MMTNHTILWRRLDQPGYEFCQLSSRGVSWLLAGTAIYSVVMFGLFEWLQRKYGALKPAN